MGKTRIAKDELVEKLKEELGIKEEIIDDGKLKVGVEDRNLKIEEEINPPSSTLKKPSSTVHHPSSKKVRSQKYQEAIKDLDRSKTYPISEAVEMVKKLSTTKFNGTLEAHINIIQTGMRGLVTLPYAPGKTEYETEPKAPVIHLALGKLNQPTEELQANIKILLSTLGKTKIKKVTLSPTMGPGVKLDLASI